MRLFQVIVTPPTPQAPAAPQAPTTAPPVPPTADQQREQIREQVRKSVEDARAAARQARTDAQRAKEQNLPAPVVVGGESGTIQPPIDWPTVQNMGENISYAFFMAVVAIAIGVPLVRAFARRLGPAPVAPPLPREVSDQLRRIEQSVEAMAIEIERISESQRFLTKLGAGKAEAASLPPRAGA